MCVYLQLFKQIHGYTTQRDMVNNRHDWASKQQRMIIHLFVLGTKSLSLEESPPQTEAALYNMSLKELQDGSRKMQFKGNLSGLLCYSEGPKKAKNVIC